MIKLNKVTDEWSYRVGTIDLKNPAHIVTLIEILREDSWPEDVISEYVSNIDNVVESLFNEESDYDKLMKKKVSYTPVGSDKSRQVQVRTALKRKDGKPHPARPPAVAFLHKKGLTPDQIEKAGKKGDEEDKSDTKEPKQDKPKEESKPTPEQLEYAKLQEETSDKRDRGKTRGGCC